MNALSRSVSAIVVITIALFLAPTAFAQDVIIRVDIGNGSVNPPGFGDDWGQDAYMFLQDALDRADFLHATIDPELEIHIWVAEGTYRPDQMSSVGAGGACPPFGDCVRSHSFELIDNVEIYGGFPPDPHTWNGGNGAVFADRNPMSYTTILDGDLQQNDSVTIYNQNRDLILDFQNYGDNSWHVVMALGIDDDALLDGFTIRGGAPMSALSGNSTSRNGAGVFISSASPRIENCIIEQNEMMPGPWVFTVASEGGGGVYVGPFSEPQFTHCAIRHNRTRGGGGGVAVKNNFDPNDPPTGIDAIPVFINCSIWENSSDRGGGIAMRDAPADLVNCSIVGNIADADGAPSPNSDYFEGGGGVSFVSNYIWGEDSHLHLWNCVVAGNKAIGSNSGGGLSVNGARCTSSTARWRSTKRIMSAAASMKLNHRRFSGTARSFRSS